MNKTTKRLLNTMKSLSILSLTILFVSCASHYVVIDGEKEVKYVAPGETVKSEKGGWLVPDARMKEILEALSKAQHDKEKMEK